MRKGAVSRKTSETEIDVAVDLDGSGKADVKTGVGFFDHMLDQLARHSLIDLTVRAEGDRHIDDHHTVEDVGIALGQALRQALGDKRGLDPLRRLPAADGRSADPRRDRRFRAAVPGLPRRIPDPEDRRLRRRAGARILPGLRGQRRPDAAYRQLYGANSHHIAESCFKGVARALGAALAIDPRQAARIPSTKGAL